MSKAGIKTSAFNNTKSPAISRSRRPDPEIPDLSPETAEVLARINGTHAQSEWSRESSAAMSISSLGSSASARSAHGGPPQSPPTDAANGIKPASNGNSQNVLFDKPRFNRSALASAFASALAPKASILPSQGVLSPNKPTAVTSQEEMEKAPTKLTTVTSQKEKEKTPKAPSPDPDSIVVASPRQDNQNRPTPLVSSPRSFVRPTKPTTSVKSTTLSASTPTADDIPQPSTLAEPTSTPTRNGTPVRTNGKGLGRGRPGIKRGPRASTLKRKRGAKDEEADDDDFHSADDKPIEKKRRVLSASHVSKDDDNSNSHSDSDSESYTPQATQTKSGRQVHRPTTFVPPESPASASKKKAGEAVVAASPPANSVTAAEPAVARATSRATITPAKVIKRKVYGKGKEQQALCEHCLRGYGPPKNLIVFCDGCNRAWHQKCHVPRITDAVVKDKDGQWFCAECDAIFQGQDEDVAAAKSNLKGKGKGKGKGRGRPSKVKAEELTAPATTPTPAAPEPTPTPAQQAPTTPQPPAIPSIPAVPTFVAHPEWSATQRESYFNNLSHKDLVSLLVQATTAHPSLELFELPPEPTLTPTKPPPPNNLTTSTASSAHAAPAPTPTPSTIPQPTPQPSHPHPSASHSPPRSSSPPSLNHPTPSSSTPHAPSPSPEMDIDPYIDEHLPLYPTPSSGNGVASLLPPEKEDLEMLLEGPECATFSHRVWKVGREEGAEAGRGMGGREARRVR